MGGAENLLRNTIAELPEYEHLIITVFGNNDLSLLPQNAEYISLGARHKAEVLLKLPAYRKILRRFKPHLVHAHLYFATILAKAGTPSRIHLVFTQHFEFSKNSSKWYYAFVDRLVSSKKQTCIAVSKVVLNDYVQSTGFKGKKQVLGIYIPDRFFNMVRQPVQERNNKELKVIALGNIKPIKNQRYLLKAFSLMKDLPVRCDIYGEGEERLQLEEEARQNNIPVFFKGPVTHSESVLPYYDLYVMPSLTEGFPLALFESMAAALPAIVSDIPVFHELLGEQGEYFSLQEPAQLRAIMEKYLFHKDLLTTRGAVMKQLAFEKASRQQFLSRLRTLYTQVLAGTNSSFAAEKKAMISSR